VTVATDAGATIRDVLKQLPPEQKFFAAIARKDDAGEREVREILAEVTAEIRDAQRDKTIRRIAVLVLYDDAG
jgi:hypothetical protein